MSATNELLLLPMNWKYLVKIFGGRPYDYIFFDLDRTLWDFESNARITLSDLYQEFELAKFFTSFDDFHETFQMHNERLWAEYRHGRIGKEMLRKKRFMLTLRSAKVKDDSLAETLDRRYIADSPTKTSLLPNTMEVMEYLSLKGYPMLIITNGFNEVQWVKLKACGLERYFSMMLTSENVGHQKPDVRIFQKALAEAGCRASRALMVGDDFNVDMVGARNAGIDQVFFNPKGQHVAFSPTYEIKDLIELKRFL